MGPLAPSAAVDVAVVSGAGVVGSIVFRVGALIFVRQLGIGVAATAVTSGLGRLFETVVG